MKTALVSSFVISGIAVVVSMGVAAMMKVLFLVIRRIGTPKKVDGSVPMPSSANR